MPRKPLSSTLSVDDLAPSRDPGALIGDMDGLRKAAVLLISLDEEAASEVLKHLSDQEAERVTKEIARLGVVEKDTIARTLTEFRDLREAQCFIREGGFDHAIRLIQRSLPEGRASRIVNLLETQEQNVPFSFLRNSESESLFTLLSEEHPQTIALVLSYMEAAKAAEIIARLSPERQYDIIKRIATLEHTSPEAIKHVEAGLKRYLASLAFEEYQEVGGIRTVAEILNVMERATEKAILENLEDERPELADEIKKLMFVFEDILLVDDRGIQNVLKEISNQQLALALKTASPELKDKVFRNMSKRAAELVQEEIQYMGPVRVADVEGAQQAVVDVVRRLEESGEVVITGRGHEGSDLIV
ncbi:MAG: flagellar motor switch protein FliG [Planctomycetes bacterium]|nr:flagellar motor switch protein FliG [Planctomycetota bacterium]